MSDTAQQFYDLATVGVVAGIFALSLIVFLLAFIAVRHM
jgi:hypothetical protein